MQYLHRKSFLMQKIYIAYDCKLLVNRFYAKNLKTILIATTISCCNFTGPYVRVRPIPSESSGSHITPCLVCLLDPTQYGTVKTNLSLRTPLRDQWTWTQSSTQSLTLLVPQAYISAFAPRVKSAASPYIGSSVDQNFNRNN
jgi:hypothetical protein